MKILFGAEGSGGRRRELSRVVIPQTGKTEDVKKGRSFPKHSLPKNK